MLSENQITEITDRYPYYLKLYRSRHVPVEDLESDIEQTIKQKKEAVIRYRDSKITRLDESGTEAINRIKIAKDEFYIEFYDLHLKLTAQVNALTTKKIQRKRYGTSNKADWIKLRIYQNIK